MAINGEQLSAKSDYKEIVSNLKAADQVTLLLNRNGTHASITYVIGAHGYTAEQIHNLRQVIQYHSIAVDSWFTAFLRSPAASLPFNNGVGHTSNILMEELADLIQPAETSNIVYEDAGNSFSRRTGYSSRRATSTLSSVQPGSKRSTMTSRAGMFSEALAQAKPNTAASNTHRTPETEKRRLTGNSKDSAQLSQAATTKWNNNSSSDLSPTAASATLNSQPGSGTHTTSIQQSVEPAKLTAPSSAAAIPAANELAVMPTIRINDLNTDTDHLDEHFSSDDDESSMVGAGEMSIAADVRTISAASSRSAMSSRASNRFFSPEPLQNTQSKHPSHSRNLCEPTQILAR